MRNKKIFGLIVFLCLFSFSVSAQPKMDLSTGLKDTMGGVSSGMETAMNKVNSALQKVFEMKEKVAGELNALKEKVDEVKELYEEGKELYEEGKEMYDEAKGMYDEAKGMYDEAVNTGKEAQSSIALKKQVEDLQKQMLARQDVIKEDLNAKLKASQTNEQTYQQLFDAAQNEDEKKILQKQLAEAQVLSADLQKNIKAASEKNTAYFDDDEEYARLQKEYETTQKDLNTALESLAAKGKSIGSDFASRLTKMSSEDKKSAYDGLINQVFIGPNEKLNASNSKRVKKSRRNKLINSSADMFVLMTKHQSQAQKFDEDNDKAVADCEKSDSLMTKLQLVNELNVKKNNVLFDQLNSSAGLIVLKSSTDLLHQDYALGNPNKNPAEINVDNYVLQEDDLKEYGLGSAK